MLQVVLINYNWFCTEEGGEDYYTHEVGKRSVIKIEMIGEDFYKLNHNVIIVPYAIIYFKDGSQQRQYNVNLIKYETTGD